MKTNAWIVCGLACFLSLWIPGSLAQTGTMGDSSSGGGGMAPDPKKGSDWEAINKEITASQDGEEYEPEEEEKEKKLNEARDRMRNAWKDLRETTINKDFESWRDAFERWDRAGHDIARLQDPQGYQMATERAIENNRLFEKWKQHDLQLRPPSQTEIDNLGNYYSEWRHCASSVGARLSLDGYGSMVDLRNVSQYEGQLPYFEYIGGRMSTFNDVMNQGIYPGRVLYTTENHMMLSSAIPGQVAAQEIASPRGIPSMPVIYIFK